MSTPDLNSTIRQNVARDLVSHFEQTKDLPRLSLARLIEVRTREPQVFVTVLGETSSGKSTLVNALVETPILPVSAAPSTGAVTHLIVHDKPETSCFAIYSDATQQEISQDEFDSLCLNPTKNLLRLQVRIPAREESHLGLHVFDTPGFNSLISAHQEVLTRFIPESDVVVFVVDYRSGFGQVQQDLLELISSLLPTEANVPMILTINLAPSGCKLTDHRVLEIVAHASDCLKREPHVVLVECATLEEKESDVPPMPNADQLWSTIAQTAANPNCQKEVCRKLDWLLKNLIQDAIAEYERKEYEFAGTDADREQILQQLLELRSARDRSQKAVQQTMRRLESKLPDILQRGCEGLKQEIESEIDDANKWADSRACAEYLGVHKLPFGARELADLAEKEIATDLDRLNNELNEIANTAADKIRDEVHIKSDASERFAENIATTITQRVAGTGVNALLRNFGGACGQAAGAGNLAKMFVSKGGNLIGKTFPREIYANIGRVFTKKMLARMNIAAMVIIEVGGYLVHVHRWQGKLKKQTSKAANEWCQETIGDLLQNQIPGIEQRNLDGVVQIYDDLIADESLAVRTSQKNLADRLKTIREWRDILRRLNQNLHREI